MRITRRQLRQIIREERRRVLRESGMFESMWTITPHTPASEVQAARDAIVARKAQYWPGSETEVGEELDWLFNTRLGDDVDRVEVSSDGYFYYYTNGGRGIFDPGNLEWEFDEYVHGPDWR
jgi:hypothetical protein